MLRWERRPNRRRPHWRLLMLRRRSRVGSVLDDSPSLWPRLPEIIDHAYEIARLTAMRQTGLPVAAFPERCLWSPDQVLDDDFLPGGPRCRAICTIDPPRLLMSRSRKKTPIFAHTTSTAEAADKAAWYRRHRAEERVRLLTEGQNYPERSHRENSNAATFDKDGKHYWAPGVGTPSTRK
jgi:Domain of unknown function DUF29